jgi:hypothetical protein
LCLWITPERGVQHHGFRLVFEVENPRNPTGPVVNVRNEVQDDFGLVGQRNLGQIVDEVATAAIVLGLERENGLPALRRRRLLPEG